MSILSSFKKKFIGDKAFYRAVLTVIVPIIVQNGISNFVSLLDNIMVGKLGTEAMSGVSIINQFTFVFYLLIFGAIAAAGIFTAQYHGYGDVNGVRHTFRFKLILTLICAVGAILVFVFFHEPLINSFLHDGSAEGDLEATFAYGKDYLFVVLIGLIPNVIAQVYASTMRETGENVMPMVASIAAVCTNFVFNLILIFGVGDFIPALGVIGAAIATNISRFVELGILVFWGHTHKEKCPYLTGAYRSFAIPKELVRNVIVKGVPLIANEFLWAVAVTVRNQAYSTRGLDVVAGENIASTVINLFSIVYLSVGSGISILIGNLLGAGKFDKAREDSRKCIAFSVMCGMGIGLLLIATSSLFPRLYNTTDAVRSLATMMIVITAFELPFDAFANASYFTLRSGGQVLITILFDSCFMWVVVVPVSLLLANFTDISIFWLYLCGQGVNTLKTPLGLALLKSGKWVRQLVADEK